MKAFVETEKGIQTAIISYLRYKGWYCMRLNSGRIRTEGGGLVMLSDPGTPDLMAFKKVLLGDGIHPAGPLIEAIDLLFIEVKRPGNKPTLRQQMKMEELETFGAKCIVATSIEDLEKQL